MNHTSFFRWVAILSVRLGPVWNFWFGRILLSGRLTASPVTASGV